MERDFMGLNSKDSAASVKGSVPEKASGSQWPLSYNMSAIPYFMRHVSVQENAANKTAASPVASPGFTQISLGFLAKRAQTPSAASIAELADPRNKSIGPPAQMTIFYNGIVKVYDSITPEKAQAILFLAGNGSCGAGVGAQVRTPTPKLASTDVLPPNNHTNAEPSSTNSSPVSVSSHNVLQSVSGSTYIDELGNNKSTHVLFSPDCKTEPPKPVTTLGSVAAPPSMIPHGIPQFRKVSLARFLEKRRERAMNAAPYNAAKKPECAS